MSNASTKEQAPAQSKPQPAPKETYFVPEEGISVQATSLDDALTQINAVRAKEGDDNIQS